MTDDRGLFTRSDQSMTCGGGGGGENVPIMKDAFGQENIPILKGSILCTLHTHIMV